jgi:recombinational DNA repair protein RecT
MPEEKKHDAPAPVPPSKLQLTSALITQQPTVKALLDLPQLEDAWVKTYQLTTGMPDGVQRFNAEKILFMKALQGNKQLQDCDKFSIYTSFTELAISGLSLRDGQAAIIPFGKEASFQPMWRGRLKQIMELPQVVHCHEPKVVYDCDEFEYTLGERTRIIKHHPGERTNQSLITHVYFVIEFKWGLDIYIMDRMDVLRIRDNRSKTYIEYASAIQKQNKQPGEKVSKKYKDKQTGEWKEFEIDPPMWVTDEAQAFKKTIVKRVYNNLPKTAKQKWIDDKVLETITRHEITEEDDFQGEMFFVNKTDVPGDTNDVGDENEAFG